MIDNASEYSRQPEAFIRELNRRILNLVNPSAGQYRTASVSLAGMDYVPPHPTAVPGYMEKLAEEIKAGHGTRSVLEFAAAMHTLLAFIHPFCDGNGRVARLLLNACLIAGGLPGIIVNFADRNRYLDCLVKCETGDLSELVSFFLECLEEQFDALLEMDRMTALPAIPAVLGAENQLPAEEAIGVKTADPIRAALEEGGLIAADDPLTAVMRARVDRMKQLREAEYEAWNQSFSALLAELRNIVDAFNANDDYRQLGFRIRVQPYDIFDVREVCRHIAEEEGVANLVFCC